MESSSVEVSSPHIVVGSCTDTSAACLDGAIHMWQASSNFVRPNMTIEGAHTKGTETGSMSFSVDGRTVLTRGGDDTVKRTLFNLFNLKSAYFPTVWDLRAFKKPLATQSGLATLYPNTNAMFSPDDKYIITGAAATSKGGKGKLMFLEKNELEVVKALEVDSTPVKVFWHSKINQVFMYCAINCSSQHIDRHVDRHGLVEWPDMRALFTDDIAKRREAAAEQRATEKSHY